MEADSTLVVDILVVDTPAVDTPAVDTPREEVVDIPLAEDILNWRIKDTYVHQIQQRKWNRENKTTDHDFLTLRRWSGDRLLPFLHSPKSKSTLEQTGSLEGEATVAFP